MDTNRRPAVLVTAYDPAWPVRFRQLYDPIWPAVSDLALAMEHIGSTSVPGLAAKPVIDLDLIIPTLERLPAIQARLEALGYHARGELGIEHRYAFSAPPGAIAHHLYVCLAGSTALLNHLALRDHLRTHPVAAEAYSALKRQLAEDFSHDIDGYVAGKTEFILTILSQSGFSADRQAAIRRANLSGPGRAGSTS